MVDPIDWTPLAEFLRARLSTPPSSPINAETPLLSSQLLDSLTLIEFVAHLQKTFAVRIPSSSLTTEQFDTLARVVQLVESLVEAGSRGKS